MKIGLQLLFVAANKMDVLDLVYFADGATYAV